MSPLFDGCLLLSVMKSQTFCFSCLPWLVLLEGLRCYPVMLLVVVLIWPLLVPWRPPGASSICMNHLCVRYTLNLLCNLHEESYLGWLLSLFHGSNAASI
jgi:hypothetical protein